MKTKSTASKKVISVRIPVTTLRTYALRLEFHEGTSYKFWEVAVAGDKVVTFWGRCGHKAQTTIKTFSNPQKALDAYYGLLRSKQNKGYQEV
jgi:predicted DNA-binding WGR domain protein